MLRKNIAILVVRQIIVGVLVTLNSFVIAKQLGSQGNGIYVSISLLQIIASSVGSLGLGVSSMYFLGSERIKFRDVVVTNFILSLISGTTIVCIFLVGLYQNLLPNEIIQNTNAVIIAIITIIPQIIFSNALAILQGQGRFSEFGVFTFVSPFFTLLFILLHTTLIGVEITVTHLTLSTLISQGIAVLVLLSRLNLLQHLLNARINDILSCSRRMLVYGLQSHIGNIVGLMNHRLNFYFVFSSVGAASSSVFAITTTISEAIWMLSSATSSVVFPIVAGFEKPGLQASIDISRISRWVLYLTTMATILICLIANTPAVDYLGKEYRILAPMLFLAAPGIIFLSFGRVISNEIAGRGMPFENTKIAVAALVLNTSINIIFIPYYGVYAAVAALSLSYCFLTTLTIGAYTFITGKTLTSLLSPKIDDFRIIWELIRARRLGN